ncbi:uncharacterized protein LOC119595291 [Penaeus monodon]|uniref:uncharacterized protein LOC119595291 n=1 Tax=Penaeus monodon TaxID=6687 RepID=UPI0018A7293E|nr:uncharacterized protein LOC119595291 [Penaeus monodon]
MLAGLCLMHEVNVAQNPHLLGLPLPTPHDSSHNSRGGRERQERVREPFARTEVPPAPIFLSRYGRIRNHMVRNTSLHHATSLQQFNSRVNIWLLNQRVCLEPDVFPTAYCLVYSFGIGHDFTFEVAMSKFGCDVYAFDSDRFHAHYPTYIGDRLTFYKARIGTTFMRQTVFRSDVPGDRGFMVEYWPLSALLRRLGHRSHHLFYLKLDIEGDEWEVLEKSLFKTRILERVQQLALEIHFEDLRANGTRSSSQELIRSIERYLRVADGLRARGFRLAQWEPNFKGPELSCLEGLCYHVYSETLWLNPSYRRLSTSPGIVMPPPRL